MYSITILILLHNITTMPPKDLKKTEHAEVRSLIARELSVVKSLKLISKKQKQELIQDLLNYKKVTETKTEHIKKKESNHENLLNKPNMTVKDRLNMEKSIIFLIDRKMDSSENLKKLEAINYGSNYIEIA